MIADVEKTIREYLPQVIHMSLATAAGDQPWVCEVHFAYDADLHLYFMSTASRRHSREIAQNPKVAGNIVRQHSPDDRPRGVYFEGTAEQLTDVDKDHPAFLAYSQRFHETEKILDEAKTDAGHKFYKISVQKYYLFDALESKPSQKYELPWGK